jgi:hypothetical protein
MRSSARVPPKNRSSSSAAKTGSIQLMVENIIETGKAWRPLSCSNAM